MNNLIIYLKELKDPRDKRGLRHNLTNIIVMSIYAILCGCTDCESIAYFLELRKEYFINLLDLDEEYGVPSADTLLRVFSAINPENFMKIFSKWIKDVLSSKKIKMADSSIALDGKAVRAAAKSTEENKIPYIVSAYLTDIGISIAQEKVEEKSNEITAIPDILDLIEIKGCMITIDAIGTQKKIIKKIEEKGGYYCLPLKANQKSAYKDISEYFKYIIETKLEYDRLDTYCEIEKGHGRTETRTTYTITDFDNLIEVEKFGKIDTLVMTKNIREIGENKTEQIKYYISNKKMSAKETSNIVRKHWQIENNLHWTLDMYFNEDKSTARTKNAIHNFALLRKICFNLIKLDDSVKRKEINKRMMYYSYDLDNLKRLIFEIYPNTNL